MKILVTGATGFIGAAVARKLSQQRHEVLALSRSGAYERSALPLRSWRLLRAGGLLGWLRSGGAWSSISRDPGRYRSFAGPPARSTECRLLSARGSATIGGAAARWRRVWPLVQRASRPRVYRPARQ